MDKNWQDLANAVVVQACKDYRRAKRIFKHKPKRYFLEEKARSNYEYAAKMLEQVKAFFKSDYYKLLTSVNADYLLARLNAEL